MPSTTGRPISAPLHQPDPDRTLGFGAGLEGHGPALDKVGVFDWGMRVLEHLPGFQVHMGQTGPQQVPLGLGQGR